MSYGTWNLTSTTVFIRQLISSTRNYLLLELKKVRHLKFDSKRFAKIDIDIHTLEIFPSRSFQESFKHRCKFNL